MKRWVLIAVVALMFTGCATAPQRVPITGGPVVPGVDEQVVVDQVVVIVDSTTSMWGGKIREAKDLAQAMFEMMPDGDYRTGMITFGGGVRKEAFGFEQPYQRITWSERAAQAPFLGGRTPLELSLEMTYSMLAGVSGKTAVIIISDGLPTYPEAAKESAQKIASLSNTEVCIYTIHVGPAHPFDNDAKGQAFLQELAGLTSCGFTQTDDGLLEEAALNSFVREVFIGKKPGVPEPVVEVPPQPPQPKDSDGDGVTDDMDQCPGTPKGAKVDERGCWVIPGVTFELDKAIVRPMFYPLLDDVVTVLNENPGMRVELDGHTCDLGTDKHNQGLSERRAKAVEGYLIDKGIEPSRLVPKGFGEKNPAFPNDNEVNRSKNRRVELTPIIQ